MIIDLEELFEINDFCETKDGELAIKVDDLCRMPPADTTRHGHWILKTYGKYQDLRVYSCSECGFELPINPTKIPAYCEDCGAKNERS